jgi:adenosine deaminase
VQTNCYDTYADHPIDRLHRAGVSVGVNTDTRTISDITLSEEYAKLHETFGWDTKDFLQCNTSALKAAFVPDDVRDELLKRLVDGYQHIPTMAM